MAKKKPESPEQDLVKRIRDRYTQASDATRDQRARSLDEVAFCDPENQWDESAKMYRKEKGIPCLTVDRMTPFLDQIANDQRQNQQAIDVHPVDDNADVETAEIIKGLIRHIEYDSNADYAYDTALMAVLRGGFGFIRLYLDYCYPDSFDQDIKIGRIQNPFMVYLDPASTEPDGSDANWGMILVDMTEGEYKAAFPDSDLAAASTTQWRSIGNSAPDWVGKDSKTVRVVEYYEKVQTPKTIVLLADGRTVDEKDAPEGAQIVNKRQSFDTTVKHVVANAVEVLAETVFPGEYIPIFPVYGQELCIDGVTQYTGLVRRMMDVQRMVNYWKSAQTHMIALSPKAPWVGPRGFRGDMEKEWANANREAYSTLEYEPVIIQGQVMPPPMRNVQEPAIGAITNALAQTEEDLKAVTGMYDPTLGNRQDSGQSGVAIRSLQHQGQLGNFHFADNLSRTIRHLGRVIVDIIPYIYDTKRTVRIIGVDNTQHTVQINSQTTDPKTGKPVLYDLTTGRYDVVVSSGPSYATKRQENLAVMMDMLHTLPPQQAVLITDLVASQMDTPIAKEISERLKLMLPPQLQEQGPNGQPPVPPQVQAQMQQAQAHMQQQDAALHDAMNQIEDLKEALASKQAEVDARIRVAEIQAEASIQVARLNGVAKAGTAAMQADADASQALLDAFIEKDAMMDQHGHEFAMAAAAPQFNGQAQQGQPQPGPQGPPNAGPQTGDGAM